MDKNSLQRLYKIQDDLNSIYESMTISPKIEFIPLKETFMANISFLGINKCYKGLKLDNKTKTRIDKFVKNVILSLDDDYKKTVVDNYKKNVLSFLNKKKIGNCILVCTERSLNIYVNDCEIFFMDMNDVFNPKINKINGVNNYYFNDNFIYNIIEKIEFCINNIDKDISVCINTILDTYKRYDNSKNKLKEYPAISKKIRKDNIFILNEKGLFLDSDCGTIFSDGHIENEIYPLNYDEYISLYDKFLRENNLSYIYSKGCLFSDYCDIFFERDGIYFDIVISEKYNIIDLFDILNEKLSIKLNQKTNKLFRISEINDFLNTNRYPLEDWLYIDDMENIIIEDNLNAQFVSYILFKKNPDDLDGFMKMLHMTEDLISLIEEDYIFLLSHYNHFMFYELVDMQISFCDDDYKVKILNNIIKKHKKYYC